MGDKPLPVPLCPPQIPYGLTQASAVRGQQLTTLAMAWLSLLHAVIPTKPHDFVLSTVADIHSDSLILSPFFYCIHI
jgi:hypothetical protein